MTHDRLIHQKRYLRGLILPVRSQRRSIIQNHTVRRLHTSIQWRIIRPQMLLILLKLLIVFGELFKEQKYLEKLDESHKLLFLVELTRFWRFNTSCHKHLMLLKFEFFPRFQDMSYSDTLRLKLIYDKVSPFK